MVRVANGERHHRGIQNGWGEKPVHFGRPGPGVLNGQVIRRDGRITTRHAVRLVPVRGVGRITAPRCIMRTFDGHVTIVTGAEDQVREHRREHRRQAGQRDNELVHEKAHEAKYCRPTFSSPQVATSEGVSGGLIKAFHRQGLLMVRKRPSAAPISRPSASIRFISSVGAVYRHSPAVGIDRLEIIDRVLHHLGIARG